MIKEIICDVIEVKFFVNNAGSYQFHVLMKYTIIIIFIAIIKPVSLLIRELRNTKVWTLNGA